MNEAEKILLILDLDETLIHSSTTQLEGIPVDFAFDKYFVYKRPFLCDFFENVKKDFRVAIWSSASDDYVESIVKQITPDDYNFEFVWGRSRCTLKRNYDLDDYFYTKPLKKLKKTGFKLERVLIVDDSYEKVKENFGNAIYVKEFTGRPDDDLKKLSAYLQLLKNEENVRKLEKRDWLLKIQNTETPAAE